MRTENREDDIIILSICPTIRLLRNKAGLIAPIRPAPNFGARMLQSLATRHATHTAFVLITPSTEGQTPFFSRLMEVDVSDLRPLFHGLPPKSEWARGLIL